MLWRARSIIPDNSDHAIVEHALALHHVKYLRAMVESLKGIHARIEYLETNMYVRHAVRLPGFYLRNLPQAGGSAAFGSLCKARSGSVPQEPEKPVLPAWWIRSDVKKALPLAER
jgi:hypothetical protein